MARALRAALLVALGFAAGVTVHARAGSPYAGLDLFARVLTQIGTHYVEPVGQERLVYEALDGMEGALDPHSEFMQPEVWKRVRADAAGEYVGIGATTVTEPCGLLVRTLVPGGPAARADVRAGDCIVAIDGTPAPGLSMDEASARLHGHEGEAVLLTLDRAGVELRAAVLRSRVLEVAVEVGATAEGIAVARVALFRERVTDDLVAKVAALGTVRGMVLDLRGNPGGRVDEAVAMADRFLGEGKIVSTRGRADGEKSFTARREGSDWSWPVAVLIDGETASAAEIVAGALRDRGRATLVGVPSYGKGSVQVVYEYEDGSALKLTVGRYVLPGGSVLGDGSGLRPDVELPMTEPPAWDGPIEARMARDGQLRAAVAAVTPR